MSLFDGYIVNQEINSILKIYPNFVRLIEYVNPLFLRRFDYDERRQYLNKEKKKRYIDEDEYVERSINRAKITINDIALCNDFDLFVTLTTNKDRYDADAKKRQIAFWLNNQRILHGKFLYIIVPEYHKDGALHFHGLLGNYGGSLVDSGKKDKGKIIYNINSYRSGWTTAKIIDRDLDDALKVSNYITKYITKDMPVFKNKQRYWCSNGLKRPLKIVNPLLNELDKEVFIPIHLSSNRRTLEYRGIFSDNDIARFADYGKRREDDLVVEEW